MQQQISPYVCHVMVCTNDRHGIRKACADGESAKLREHLKALVHQDPDLSGRVRVSSTGCMGLCAQGPNVMLYPQAIWFSGVALADAPRLLAEIKAVVVKQGCPAQT